MEAEPEQIELEVVIDSADYQKILDAYTDKTGKLSYELLNKDLIKFVHASSTARKMIADKASAQKIRLYAAGTKFRHITGDRNLTDEQVRRILELLDKVYPKGVLREFNAEVRKALK